MRYILIILLLSSCSVFKEIPYNDNPFETQVLIYKNTFKGNITAYKAFNKLQDNQYIKHRYILHLSNYIMIPLYNDDILSNKQVKHWVIYETFDNNFFKDL